MNEAQIWVTVQGGPNTYEISNGAALSDEALWSIAHTIADEVGYTGGVNDSLSVSRAPQVNVPEPS